MKEILKTITRQLGIYHSLQRRYRNIRNSIITTFYKLKYRKYKGEGYTCNACGLQYTKFISEFPSKLAGPILNELEVVAGYGENVYCPNCFSKNRDRLLIAFFSEEKNLSGKRILHFSPEKALATYIEHTSADITFVDLHPEFYKQITKKITKADATNLQFPDNFFDLVIANHILEHIPDDRKALSEIFRVVKKAGIAILQVPFSIKTIETVEDPFICNPYLQEKLFGQADHVRIYAKHDFEKRAEDVGFKICTLQIDALEKYGRFATQKNEVIFLFQK